MLIIDFKKNGGVYKKNGDSFENRLHNSFWCQFECVDCGSEENKFVESR